MNKMKPAQNANYKTYVLHRIRSRSVPTENGCLEYHGKNGNKLKHKYGLVSVKGKRIPASRAIYMVLNDCFDLPEYIKICHKCDNPPCINEDHLFRGTAKDNVQDMIKKERQSRKRSPHVRQCKLTNEQICLIRSLPWTIMEIAAHFGITNGYVSKIKNGKAKALVSPEIKPIFPYRKGRLTMRERHIQRGEG